MDNEISVDLLCLSCHAQLRGEPGRTYQSGDTVKCDACGALNDYDKVIEAAQQEVARQIRERAGGEMNISFEKDPGK